jgi:hypothetical protein
MDRPVKREITTFSHSMLSSWKRCKQRFQWSYVDGYIGPPSLGQARGSAGHAAMDHYYSNDRDIFSSLEIAYNKFVEILGPDYNEKEWDLLEMILIRYHNWAIENDKFEVLSTEEHFELDFPNGVLQGFIDGVVKVKDSVWLLEHKFNKNAQTAHLDIDAQVSTYMLAAHLLGYKPTGVLYNIIRVSDGPTAKKSPVERRMVYRNPEGLQVFAREISDQMLEIKRHLAEGGFVYRNLNSDCSWDCPFLGVCLSISDMGDGTAVLDTFERRPFDDK